MYSVIDLFSGCGGMSLGFNGAGFRILGAVEIDPTAIRTHALNFFGAGTAAQARHARPHDITELSPAGFLDTVMEDDSQRNVDVIIGGPPCQAFARVGRAKLREIMEHPEAFLKDERANLHLRFLRYVDFFRPRAVVMENVPDIMNFGGTNVAQEIAFSLEDLGNGDHPGYEVRYTILNAAHYGVPQMRQRFFLIAIRKDLGIVPTFPNATNRWELPQGYENAHLVALGADTPPLLTRYVAPPSVPEYLPNAVTAEDALKDLPPIDVSKVKRGTRRLDTFVPYRCDVEPSDYALKMREWAGFESHGGVWDHVTRYLPRDYKIFQRMKPGDQYPDAHRIAVEMFNEALMVAESCLGRSLSVDAELCQELRREYVPPYDPGKFPNKWRKMERDHPARTLTAHIGKDTYSHIHYDDSQRRVLSVREAARLQSFPDGFRFEGAMNAAFRQIGNAVPPLLAYHLALHVRRLLEENEQK